MFKQKTAYEMRISDWSSDVCSSDLFVGLRPDLRAATPHRRLDVEERPVCVEDARLYIGEAEVAHVASLSSLRPHFLRRKLSAPGAPANNCLNGWAPACFFDIVGPRAHLRAVRLPSPERPLAELNGSSSE